MRLAAASPSPAGVTQEQYTDCFQKIKYSFNLLGKLAIHLEETSAPQFVHLIFQTLNLVSRGWTGW